MQSLNKSQYLFNSYCLTGLALLHGKRWGKQQVQPQQQTCPQCGFSYKQFLKEGKFGCPSCYDTFGDHLPKLFNRIQAGPQHIGKMPGARSNVYVIKSK